jgi:hypothetical protein
MLNYLDALSPRARGHGKSLEAKSEIFRLTASQLWLSTTSGIAVFVHRAPPLPSYVLKDYPDFVLQDGCAYVSPVRHLWGERSDSPRLAEQRRPNFGLRHARRIDDCHPPRPTDC